MNFFNKDVFLVFMRLSFLSPTLLCMVMSSHAVGRVQVSAAEATDNLGIASGDIMLPVYGGVNDFAYSDVMGSYGTDGTYSASPGAGVRTTLNNQIIGAYFFGDYQETSLGANFWVLSPGVEWMTPKWDAHINGYFPTSTSQQTGSAEYADTFGVYNYMNPIVGTHDEYDAALAPNAVIGDGADAEIGYSFDSAGDKLRTRVSLGAYYYQAPSKTDVDNIAGLIVGFSKALTRNLSVSMANSYDQVMHYNVNMSLTLTFGGDSNTFSGDVSDRLLDSVQRHVGILATGAGQYDQQDLEIVGEGKEYDKIYYASENGTGDGTYGNAMAFNQENVDNAVIESGDGVRIYLAEGNYVINASTGAIEFINGQDVGAIYLGTYESIFGMSSDYKSPASTGAVVVTSEEGYSGIAMTSEGAHTISDVTLTTAPGAGGAGIIVDDSSSNDEAVNIINTSVSNFSTGIFGMNRSAGNLMINLMGSSFNDSYSTNNNAYGMNVLNTSSGNLIINATNSEFNNNEAVGTETTDVSAVGFYASNTGSGNITVNAINSDFNSNTASTTNTSVMADGFGVYLVNNGAGAITFSANSSSFDSNNAAGAFKGAGSIAAGVYAYNLNSGNLHVATNHSTFNDNVANNISSNAYGINAVNLGSGTLTLNASYSEFNRNRADDFSGIFSAGLSASNFGTGQLNIASNYSEFNNSLSLSYGGYGMYVVNGAGANNIEIIATNSEFNNNSRTGLYVENNSTAGLLSVTDLSNSSFNGNTNYGVYGYAEPSSEITIDNKGSMFSSNGIASTGGTGNVIFTP